MASGQTQYYELNQWEGRDQVLRTEFNADNARIDRALHELRARNCQLYMLTYTGTGSGGRSFTFPHRPAAVLIMGGIVTFCVRSRGNPTSICGTGTWTTNPGLYGRAAP